MEKPIVLALGSYSIRQAGNQFFVSPSAMEGRHRWTGPHASLQHAAMAIARKLQREFAKHQRRMS
jgi:hypothetical protein